MHILQVICLWWWWFVFLDYKGNKKGKFLIKNIAEAYVQPDPRCSDIRVEHNCWIFKNCFWNRSRQCVQMFGTEAPASKSPASKWKQIGTTTTEPPDCRAMKDEYTCAYSSDCFWKHDDGKCFPRHAECYELDSPTFCSFNHLCFWNKFDNSCHSVAGGCDMIYAKEVCGQSTLCKWDYHGKICIYSCKNDNARRDSRGYSCADRYDHHTNECGDFDAPTHGFYAQRECCRCRDERCDCSGSHAPVCGSDGKTYSNPCSARCNQVQITHHGSCGNFMAMECEYFTTPLECNHAEFGNTQCIWKNNECEQVVLDCEDIDDEKRCNEILINNRKCYWQPNCDERKCMDFIDQCEQEKLAPSPEENFNACSEFKNKYDCNGAQKGMVECYWLGFHCYEYVLDCEDLQSAKLCTGAKTQDISCVWRQGECDDAPYDPAPIFYNNNNNRNNGYNNNGYNNNGYNNNGYNNNGYGGDRNVNYDVYYYHSGSLSKSRKKSATAHIEKTLIKNEINQIREKQKQQIIKNQIQKLQPKHNILNKPMYFSPESSSNFGNLYVGEHLPQENEKFQIENQIKFFRTPLDELDHPQMSNTTHIIIEITFFTSFLIFILLLIWIFKPPFFPPEVSVTNSLSNSISQTLLLSKRDFLVVEDEKNADDSGT